MIQDMIQQALDTFGAFVNGLWESPVVERATLQQVGVGTGGTQMAPPPPKSQTTAEIVAQQIAAKKAAAAKKP